MVTSSKHLKNGNFARCAFCYEPFLFRDGHVEVWRASNGEHFCSEFCADDAEEAQFRERHAIAPSVATNQLRQPDRSCKECLLKS